MKKSYLELHVFRNELKHALVLSILDCIEKHLLADLPGEYRNIFMWQHQYQIDPNNQTAGETVSLLGRLLREAGCTEDMFSLHKAFSCEFHLYDVHQLTGVRAISIVKRAIEAVNEVWEKKQLARISFESRPSADFGAPEGAKQHVIVFTLL
ncbi:MAG: hypothetical protein MUD00_02755 [Candidatus Pacebacteria bacterium]|nr:hypothetical protein [Candidatus Paceibacterota bacterium]